MTDTSVPENERLAEETFSAVESNVAKFPSYDVGNFEVPELVREMTEKSITQTKEAYATVKTAAEEATEMMEDAYESARKGYVDFNMKLIDQTQSNTDRTFAFAKELMGAKSFSDALELQTRFAREQFETFAAQTKDLQEMGAKYASETSVPMKEAWERTTQKMKVA